VLISHDRDFIDRAVNGVIVPEGDGRWTEYAGGYSDMLAQRGGDIWWRLEADGKQSRAARPKTRGQPKKPDRRKLNFNQQHALKTLPQRMEKLQARIAELQGKLDDAGLYTRDPKAFSDYTDALVKAQADLAAAEEEWLELELLREEIEGSV
jgi:ATP-binding cassette subfamily F protein uup